MILSFWDEFISNRKVYFTFKERVSTLQQFIRCVKRPFKTFNSTVTSGVHFQPHQRGWSNCWQLLGSNSKAIVCLERLCLYSEIFEILMILICGNMGLTQAEGSEVQHRSIVAAGVHYMILVLKYQAAAFRQRTKPIVFIITAHLSAEVLKVTLWKETVEKALK